MKGQELLNGDVRVDPSPRDGEEKERRAMIPASRFKQFEDEFHEIARHFDSSETNALERRLWKAWERFKGTRK